MLQAPGREYCALCDRATGRDVHTATTSTEG